VPVKQVCLVTLIPITNLRNTELQFLHLKMRMILPLSQGCSENNTGGQYVLAVTESLSAVIGGLQNIF
jgi:hypothetical protein